MFWREDFTRFDNGYNHKQKERTSYTYSNSFSYRNASNQRHCDEPYLARKSLKHEFNLHESDLNIDDGMSLKKTGTNPIGYNVNNTPTRKKNLSGNCDRVLRPRVNSRPEDSSVVHFVREIDDNSDYKDYQNSYKLGALNTNTNNSGPDELEDNRFRRINYYNYDLSADEDLGSDTLETENVTTTFDSNNANSKSSDKPQSQWFQKNIYGLPNEESDDINQDLSGAISGDEQFDISQYKKTISNNKSKSSKLSLKKSSKSDRNENMAFSPIAMLSFLLESFIQIFASVSRKIILSTRRIFCNSNLNRVLMAPFYFIEASVHTITGLMAYSLDKLFGTSYYSRFAVNNRTKPICRKYCWLIIFIIFILLSYLFLYQYTIDKQTSHSNEFNVLNYGVKLVGNDCMKTDQRDYLSLSRRFVFCLFSLPARMILSNSNEILKAEINVEDIKESESTVPLQDTEHVSKDIFSSEDWIKFQNKLDYQIKELENLKSIVKKLEDSKVTSYLYKSNDDKLAEIEKNIKTLNNKFSLFESDLSQLNQMKMNIGENVSHLSENQLLAINSFSSGLDKLKQKMTDDLSVLNNQIKKMEQDSSINSATNSEHKILLAKLQIDFDNLKKNLNEVDGKTISIVQSQKQLIDDSNMMKEKLKDIDKEFNKVKLQQETLLSDINEKLSIFEYSLNENQSSFLNKDYLDTFLLSYSDQMKSNMQNYISSTLWNNFTNYVRTVVKSRDISHDQTLMSNNQKSCNCFHPSCRCLRGSTACVRMNQVRQLVNDAINLFAADQLGMADFALESAGGTVITTRCTETYTDRASTLTVFGIPLMRLTNSPRTIIQPNMNPGECWPMKGSFGSVVIKLSAKINVTRVSIDHIPKSLSPSESIDSAIRDFEIRILENETTKIGQSIGNFTYQKESDSVQTFEIENPVETRFIELVVKTNHGNKEYTCIYRFRVHGKLIEI